MAENKPLAFNKKNREEFLKRMEEKPTDRTHIFYQAIIVSLIAHIFILFITHMLSEDNTMVERKFYQPLEMDMIEPELMQQLPDQVAELMTRTGELRNVAANENSERTNEVVNYRGMTKQQINEQVYNDLKAMEAEEFAKLNEGKPDVLVNQNDKNNADSKQRSKQNDWYNQKAQEKSYSGNVTAAFNMSGRDANYNPVPTYRCKTHGVVVINITINTSGEVTDARVNEPKSSLNECLRAESEMYAKKWKFNYKEGAEKKQDGTITFTFSAQ